MVGPAFPAGYRQARSFTHSHSKLNRVILGEGEAPGSALAGAVGQQAVIADELDRGVTIVTAGVILQHMRLVWDSPSPAALQVNE